MIPVRLGIVGLGYWGPNYVRAAGGILGAELRYCCDTSSDALNRIAPLVSGVTRTTSYDDLLTADDCDAIIVATPTVFHYDLARRAIAAAKHVLVEKPLTNSTATAKAIADDARRAKVVAMVGHIYMYNPAIEFILEEVGSGAAGKARSFFASRIAFSPVRDDVDALWDLAPHDIAMMVALANEVPDYACAVGNDYLRAGRDDVVLGTLHFPSGAVGGLRVSWQFPYKERRFDFVAERKTYVFDEVSSEVKLRVYEGSELARNGVTTIPAIAPAEPLRAQLQHFVNAIVNGTPVRTPFEQGEAVVSSLEALARSARERRIIHLDDASKG